MSQQLRISAKHLGQIALADFCPRCFWTRLRCADKLPFQIFPGIFASFDSFQKRVTTLHHQKYGTAPKWLDGFGDLGEPLPIPHHSVFQTHDTATNILLTGVPDEMFRQKDGTLVILDNKTARFTKNQDVLLPLYEIQLNGYGFIAERLGMGKVSGLGLVYYEPQTELTTENIDAVLADDGFAMRFSAKLLPLELQLDRIPPLLHQVRSIFDLAKAPTGRDGCRDCKLLDGLLKTVMN